MELTAFRVECELWIERSRKDRAWHLEGARYGVSERTHQVRQARIQSGATEAASLDRNGIFAPAVLVDFVMQCDAVNIQHLRRYTLANTFLSELEPSHSDRNSGNAEHHSQAPIGTSSGQKSNRGDHQSDLEEDFR